MSTLQSVTGWPPSEIDQRVRPLLARSKIISGPRGDRAPDLDVSMVAFVLLSLASRKATEADETVMRAIELVLVCAPEMPGKLEAFSDKMVLPVAMGFLVVRPGWLNVRRLEVASHGRRAWLTIEEDGRVFDLLFVMPEEHQKVTAFIDRCSKRYANQGAASIGHRLVIGGGWFEQFGIEFAKPAESQRGERNRVTV